MSGVTTLLSVAALLSWAITIGDWLIGVQVRRDRARKDRAVQLGAKREKK